MLWVDQILEGAEFTMETINLMMFISEEACQMANMAVSTALDRGNLDLAEEVLNGVMADSRSTLNEIIIVYALAWIPSWMAFWTFLRATAININDMSEKLERYKILRDLGYDISDYNVRRKSIY